MQFQSPYTTQHSDDGRFRVVQTVAGVYAEFRDSDDEGDDDWFDVDDAVPTYGSVEEAKNACRKMAASMTGEAT